jgi:hypothetical protein
MGRCSWQRWFRKPKYSQKIAGTQGYVCWKICGGTRPKIFLWNFCEFSDDLLKILLVVLKTQKYFPKTSTKKILKQNLKTEMFFRVQPLFTKCACPIVRARNRSITLPCSVMTLPCFTIIFSVNKPCLKQYRLQRRQIPPAFTETTNTDWLNNSNLTSHVRHLRLRHVLAYNVLNTLRSSVVMSTIWWPFNATRLAHTVAQLKSNRQPPRTGRELPNSKASVASASRSTFGENNTSADRVPLPRICRIWNID